MLPWGMARHNVGVLSGARPAVLVLTVSIEHRETNMSSTLLGDEQTISRT